MGRLLGLVAAVVVKWREKDVSIPSLMGRLLGSLFFFFIVLMYLVSIPSLMGRLLG